MPFSHELDSHILLYKEYRPAPVNCSDTKRHFAKKDKQAVSGCGGLCHQTGWFHKAHGWTCNDDEVGQQLLFPGSCWGNWGSKPGFWGIGIGILRLICALTYCSEELTISIMMGQRVRREVRGVSTRVKMCRCAAEGGTTCGWSEWERMEAGVRSCWWECCQSCVRHPPHFLLPNHLSVSRRGGISNTGFIFVCFYPSIKTWTALWCTQGTLLVYLPTQRHQSHT